MLKIALIVGSTRPNRFADRPAGWVMKALTQRDDVEAELLDLRDYPLPFYAEGTSPSRLTNGYSTPVATDWARKIGSADAFIMTAAEYNRSATAVLKNALDYAYAEWNNKPVAFVGYGGVGGARAIEHLRLMAVELQMAPIRNAVHLPVHAFMAMLTEGKTFDDFPFLAESRDAMIDQLVWWATALKAAREAPANR